MGRGRHDTRSNLPLAEITPVPFTFQMGAGLGSKINSFDDLGPFAAYALLAGEVGSNLILINAGTPEASHACAEVVSPGFPQRCRACPSSDVCVHDRMCVLLKTQPQLLQEILPTRDRYTVLDAPGLHVVHNQGLVAAVYTRTLQGSTDLWDMTLPQNRYQGSYTYGRCYTCNTTACRISTFVDRYLTKPVKLAAWLPSKLTASTSGMCILPLGSGISLQHSWAPAPIAYLGDNTTFTVSVGSLQLFTFDVHSDNTCLQCDELNCVHQWLAGYTKR